MESVDLASGKGGEFNRVQTPKKRKKGRKREEIYFLAKKKGEFFFISRDSSKFPNAHTRLILDTVMCES